MAKVIMAPRTDFERHYWLHPLLHQFLVYQMLYETKHKMVETAVHGAGGYAASANAAAYAFVDQYPDAEWLLMLDNDTVPPADLPRMLDEVGDEIDVLTPVVRMMNDAGNYPMQGWYRGDDAFEPVVPGTGLKEVDRAGGGCIFIRRKVFEAMPRPYFRVVYDEMSQLMLLTDDVYFQENARKLGFRLWCNTGFYADHFHTDVV